MDWLLQCNQEDGQPRYDRLELCGKASDSRRLNSVEALGRVVLTWADARCHTLVSPFIYRTGL
jgi:hypothetical protein